ncbi:MAG: GOLPH3/VPS74 family protein [Dermatophilaceae bacterium]
MLITESLLLLLTDDKSGKPTSSSTMWASVETALGGALLVDLAAGGRLSFTGHRGKPVVHVADPRPTGIPILDTALARLAERPGESGERAERAIGRIGKGAEETTYEMLAARGLVRREDGRILGLFPTTRWPAADATAESEVRAELHAALVDNAAPTTRAAALASLLLALGQLGLVVDKPHRKAATVRATHLAAGDPAGDAVTAAVKAASDATTVAIIATTTTSAATTAAITSC